MPGVEGVTRAAVSTIAPRAVLTSKAPGFIAAISFAPIRPRVWSVSLTWMLTTSEVRSNSSSGTNGRPSWAERSPVGWKVQSLHAHADALGEACGGDADRAGADDAEHLAAQHRAERRFPDSLAKLIRLEAKPAGGGEHQRQSVLGDDRGGQPGDVAHRDCRFFR